MVVRYNLVFSSIQGVDVPIYEYRCANCGFEKEYLQKLSDAPITDCERCGRPTMAKLVSAAGFQLKGSGWYATDFKNNGAKPKAKEDSKTDAPAGDSGTKPSPDTKSNAECGASACSACLPAR
jgi:putative FmdB family regulatory protein